MSDISIVDGVHIGDGNYIFGEPVTENREIRNLPKNTLRVRFRITQDDFAQCFVKLNSGLIEHWYLGEDEAGLYLLAKQHEMGTL